jgi:hypothetical protein
MFWRVNTRLSTAREVCCLPNAQVQLQASQIRANPQH